MGTFIEMEGDLLKLSLVVFFLVIAHGCNCFCTQLSGLAPQMVKAFGTDKNFELEGGNFKGDINKLGQIDYCRYFKREDGSIFADPDCWHTGTPDLYVVNAYTQFNYGSNHADGDTKPVDYEAITLCMRKINHTFKGQHIGLPKIGAGLAGGDWNRIKSIIQKELKDCNVTVVNYDK